MKEIFKKAVVLLLAGALIFGISMFFNAFADEEIPTDGPTETTRESETPPISETTDIVTEPPTDPPTEPPTEPTTDPVTFEQGSEYEIITNLNERDPGPIITMASSTKVSSKTAATRRNGSVTTRRAPENVRSSEGAPPETIEGEPTEVTEEETFAETVFSLDEEYEKDTGKRIGTGKIIAVIVLAAAVIAAAAVIIVLKKID